ncbi:hypothetical protein DFJ74DRAFT_687080 [Hyaloraphidium curvatum]|nr:hypothetical protein DFJ74DRAFT_687080 [Hyaloraphidium curvatum]
MESDSSMPAVKAAAAPTSSEAASASAPNDAAMPSENTAPPAQRKEQQPAEVASKASGTPPPPVESTTQLHGAPATSEASIENIGSTLWGWMSSATAAVTTSVASATSALADDVYTALDPEYERDKARKAKAKARSGGPAKTEEGLELPKVIVDGISTLSAASEGAMAAIEKVSDQAMNVAESYVGKGLDAVESIGSNAFGWLSSTFNLIPQQGSREAEPTIVKASSEAEAGAAEPAAAPEAPVSPAGDGADVPESQEAAERPVEKDSPPAMVEETVEGRS